MDSETLSPTSRCFLDINLDNTFRTDIWDSVPRGTRSLVEASCSGVSVLSLCEKGDAMIMEETVGRFSKKKRNEER